MSKQTLFAIILGAAIGSGAPQGPVGEAAKQARSLTTSKFEVASVRECEDPSQPTRLDFSPGRISLTCWPLMRLIQDAYDLFATGKVDPRNPLQPVLPIEGLPGWVRSTRYSIHANPDVPQTQALMRGPMMQRLLEDRFGLRIRRESKEVPVYVMTLPNGAAKLRPSKEGSCKLLDPTDLSQPSKNMPGGTPWCAVVQHRKNDRFEVIDIPGVTLDVFSRLIHPGRPVMNRTGLTGTFDIHLEWEQGVAEASSDSPRGLAHEDLSSFVGALREQLGIRLDAGRGPQEFLVVEHIARTTEN